MTEDRDRLASAIDREAAALVRLYDVSESTKVSLLSVSENRVYLVEDPAQSGNHVIRVNSGRLSYHTAPSVESELRWLMALRRDTDIQVPEVLPAKDGALVQTLDAPDLDKPRHAAVYSFLPGREPPEDDLLPGFERLGAISARMHSHAKGWTPPPGFARHAWTAEAILDDRLSWGPWQAGAGIEGEARDLLTRLDVSVRERLGRSPKDRDHYGLIHADLRLANLLVDGDRTAIIDFDDCGYGWYLFDLAAALSFLEERPDLPDLIAAWCAGYRTVAPLPETAEDEIPTLIMLRRLQLIGWVGYQRHHIDFARDIADAFTADSCRLAEDYLGRYT